MVLKTGIKIQEGRQKKEKFLEKRGGKKKTKRRKKEELPKIERSTRIQEKEKNRLNKEHLLTEGNEEVCSKGKDFERGNQRRGVSKNGGSSTKAEKEKRGNANSGDLETNTKEWKEKENKGGKERIERKVGS